MIDKNFNQMCTCLSARLKDFTFIYTIDGVNEGSGDYNGGIDLWYNSNLGRYALFHLQSIQARAATTAAFVGCGAGEPPTYVAIWKVYIFSKRTKAGSVAECFIDTLHKCRIKFSSVSLDPYANVELIGGVKAVKEIMNSSGGGVKEAKQLINEKENVIIFSGVEQVLEMPHYGGGCECEICECD